MFELTCKMAGSLCVLAAAAAFGESKARTLVLRVRQLQQFQRSLKLLSAEITFSRALLPYAFQAVARQLEPPLRELYRHAASTLLAGDERSAREIWDSAVAKIYPQSSFTPADMEIISSLGVSLGVSEQEGQLKQIGLTLQHLELALETAREQRQRNEKMWRYLGFAGGAALVILLL
jgi:stage III sporulation protein AB